ncbi:bifunctional hydroxymethylpyrimidine kinase/phosphomethylpyrimidine kinase [Allofournierella massiliensis]|uniref:pyridoxal kinase n=1 Tax=Allofournierella massiliensis TaxID=1650663 RepID=A0A4R1QIL0_9FIRM|nr:bifunctional hydroxymethylpyrimidine kinase/phosphomethylpyrimidine kinase [Fournierella massiliensis]TCL53336.1 pyridoxine kinase [Fournierella massiliensis]
MKHTAPKTILCIHDLSGMGRCSLSVAAPVLAAMGHQPVLLPTTLLSAHTGGLGKPVVQPLAAYGDAALDHYRKLGVEFDCIYSGYLASEAEQQLVHKAFSYWPGALKVVDPVLADHGRFYTGMQDLLPGMRELCRQADLILPNLTEACFLLGRDYCADELTADQAQALADEVSANVQRAVVTGLPLAKHLACAGSSGRDRFVVKRLRIDRSYPGTGDLFAAVLVGCLLRGNALSAAADAAAGFVAEAINNTSPTADPAFGVWFEPLLGRLCGGN